MELEVEEAAPGLCVAFISFLLILFILGVPEFITGWGNVLTGSPQMGTPWFAQSYNTGGQMQAPWVPATLREGGLWHCRVPRNRFQSPALHAKLNAETAACARCQAGQPHLPLSVPPPRPFWTVSPRGEIRNCWLDVLGICLAQWLLWLKLEVNLNPKRRGHPAACKKIMGGEEFHSHNVSEKGLIKSSSAGSMFFP